MPLMTGVIIRQNASLSKLILIMVFFSANTNKLNCNNVIVNVSKFDYDRSLRIYKKSLQERSPDGSESD